MASMARISIAGITSGAAKGRRTTVDPEAELFAVTGSLPTEVAVTEAASEVPAVMPNGTVTLTVGECEAPSGVLPTQVQTTLPVLPTAGVVQVAPAELTDSKATVDAIMVAKTTED